MTARESASLALLWFNFAPSAVAERILIGVQVFLWSTSHWGKKKLGKMETSKLHHESVLALYTFTLFPYNYLYVCI